MNFLRNKPIQYLIVALICMIIPLVFKLQQSTMTMLNLAVIYSIIALGFNILLGYAGQISLGHAAFMGLGAYVSANMVSQLHMPFLLSLLVSGLVPMLIGLLLGMVALRLEGHYLAIATLGFGVAIQQVFKEWISFTNGYSGMTAKFPTIFGINFRSREYYFILSITVLFLLSVFAYNLLKSKTGRALIAMRDSEHAAQAMGISLFKYKLVAFALSAFYAGIAGSLYMHLIRFTEPNQWGIELSLNLLAMVVIGGLASIEGSILGAFFLTLVPELIKEIPFLQNIKNVSSIFTGAALILIIMFFPYGLARVGTQLKQSLLSKKKKEQLT
ncbi:branched-chain amino acid ABC transporter permease [Caldisalinibacter kiritimatiensis]|uniref:Branched-chain amino acid transport system permease protein LivM n=1 Tax=Caldisalinibacter kiritimatiensis TaxID=1304284 RepID=R1AT68_9FIRM|nr:branched-chain amino acid ABC transporter permease [Caldisalinibacter kiritimatiensis]EOD00328.1 Branched-chain amino acid transport system permease protein LivM [Caldisalinibacter kiritimatiensis]